MFKEHTSSSFRKATLALRTKAGCFLAFVLANVFQISIMSFVSAKTKHAQSKKSNASILTAHKKRSCFRLFGRHCYFRKCFHTKTKPRNKFNESQAAGMYNPKTPRPHERSSKHASRPVSWPDFWRAATEFTAVQITTTFPNLTEGY